MKKSLKGAPAMANDEAGRAAVEKVAMQLFTHADTEDRDDRASRLALMHTRAHDGP